MLLFFSFLLDYNLSCLAKRSRALRGRNPRTSEKVMVPAKCTTTFKPGLAMQARVEEENRTAAMTAPVAVRSPEYGT
jgi:hypothetical protein